MKELCNKSSGSTVFFYRWGNSGPKIGSDSPKDYRDFLATSLLFFLTIYHWVYFYQCRTRRDNLRLKLVRTDTKTLSCSRILLSGCFSNYFLSPLLLFLNIWRANALIASITSCIQMISKSALPIVIFHWCSNPVLPYLCRVSPIGMNAPQ